MSLFGTIMSKIFGTHAEAAPAGGGSSASAGSSPSSTAPGGVQTASTGSASTQVDVAQVLGDMAAKNSQQHLDWKHSIVDLMKLLGMDSSLEHRKELAKELHYDGDISDSATMNVWLSKQVMKKLGENGGKLPEDLKAA